MSDNRAGEASRWLERAVRDFDADFERIGPEAGSLPEYFT